MYDVPHSTTDTLEGTRHLTSLGNSDVPWATYGWVTFQEGPYVRMNATIVRITVPDPSH